MLRVSSVVTLFDSRSEEHELDARNVVALFIKSLNRLGVNETWSNCFHLNGGYDYKCKTANWSTESVIEKRPTYQSCNCEMDEVRKV